jgi:molecular chaperone GrpE
MAIDSRDEEGFEPIDEQETGSLDRTVEARGEQSLTLEEQLGQELEMRRRESEELMDKYRRSVAEFANYRKRQERERDQQRIRITLDVLRQLLPLMDDFDRALASVPEGTGLDSSNGSLWLEGLELIRRKLDGILDSFGVRRIEAVGKPFDPFFHEALMQVPNDNWPPGIVVDEVQKGYVMGDEVLRPTLVVVSSGAGGDDENA